MLMILFLFFFALQAQNQTPLLKMRDNSQCIKQVIDGFIKKQSCEKLSESEKSQLAIKMTNCLNLKLGKPQIQECKSLRDCNIQGDDWNTFTTFFTHIDNLCHFYWDILHHQRTEKLVSDLSDSAILSESILERNYQSTQKILSMQETIQSFMDDSVSYNKRLSQSLKYSEGRLQNMTQHIQSFLEGLNENLLEQYSTIINVMSTINNGIEGVNTVQTLMLGEIGTISGILYFLLFLLIICIVTSFQAFRKIRYLSFLLFGTNILLQIMFPQFLLFILGVRLIRVSFVLFQLFLFTRAFFSRDNNFDRMKDYMDGRLDTKRIKRIFKQILQEGKAIQNNEQLEQHEIK